MNKCNYTVAGSAVKAIGFEEAVLKWMTNCIYLMYMLHSDGIRTSDCIKNGEFAGKMMLYMVERYKF